jgi:transaldolase
MQIFLDTANIDEIRQAHAWGVIDGVTTNPSLIAKNGGDFIQTIFEIAELVDGPVSAETIAQDTEGMVREGRLLAQIHPQIVVKIPLTPAGIAATKQLSSEGIKTNVTLCFQANQALLAAKVGATYISPFLGRLDDVSQVGVGLIEEIVQIYDNYGFETQVLAASIRHPKHMVDVALAGADVATLPFSILSKMFKHPLTDAGNERFLKDWESVPNNDIEAAATAWLEKNQ